MKFCTECGTKAEFDEQRFCKVCGHKFPEVPFTPENQQDPSGCYRARISNAGGSRSAA